MTDKIFIDTNILVYAFVDNDLQKKEKAQQAIYKEIFDDTFLISTQTIGEFTATLIRGKIKHTLIEQYFYEIIDSFPVVKIDIDILSDAYKIQRKYSLSWWDSVIVSTAIQNNCNILYSEDLNNLTIIENKLKIINPLL